MFERLPLSPVRPWAARYSGTVTRVIVAHAAASPVDEAVARPAPARAAPGTRRCPAAAAARCARRRRRPGRRCTAPSPRAPGARRCRASAWLQRDAQAHVARVAGGCAASQRPASSPNTLATPIRSTRSGPSPAGARAARRPPAARGPRRAAPAYEISPSASQPVSWQTLTFSAGGRAWPRTPRRRTRSAPTLGDLGFADVGDDVGRQVGGRVVHFVQQLLLDGVRVDAAAGAGRLGDRAVAVGVDLGDRVAERGEAGHVLEAGVGVVAAADLRAAFEQVAGHRRAGEAVPVVARPAEVRERRADGQRRVGDAAADDDLGAGEQRVGDRLGAEVGVGADDVEAVAARAERGAQQRAVRRAAQVVALDDRDARRAQAEFARQRRRCAAPRRAGWRRRSC